MINGSALRGAIPDGQLCGAGLTADGRYASMDTPGAWQTTDVTDDFTVVFQDQAHHGTDYFQVYVSKQGYDPKTQPLGWDDLELVAETGSMPPGEINNIEVWQAAHLDQSYCMCSDVDFG
ncbi:lytic polysaccharide monooxygenase [Streptomyces johnsoniae]|uniref:Lytic polysaccharide monooxygenase n=1 Tax=Streptomyces johnsoniae TaxID=3075532 RepID=A0ABU2SDB7_9ACTN|nr:lytic polysaccharide monooxygenase [Streptomyces sp. DSM 41886]MDT0446966.1 lytic polysaccharide monooxygenase [Streptomyces sp. DSM 41886]